MKNLIDISIVEMKVKNKLRDVYYSFSRWQQEHFRVKLTYEVLSYQVIKIAKYLNTNKYIKNMIQKTKNFVKNDIKEAKKFSKTAVLFLVGLMAFAPIFGAGSFDNSKKVEANQPEIIQETAEVTTVELADNEPCQNLELSEETACLLELIK